MKTPARSLRLIEVYDETRSTMDHEPAETPAVVAAETQTRGRGRTGAWHSPPGGAWLTLYTRAEPPPGYPVAVAGCLAARLEKLLEGAQRLEVKWPNDIVARDCRKIAGILVESRGELLRVGIGVNVYNQPPPGAASLAELGYHRPLAETILEAAEAALEALSSPQRCIREAQARDHLSNAIVEIETPEGRLEAEAKGIAGDGALIVKTYNGEVKPVYCCHTIRHQHR